MVQIMGGGVEEGGESINQPASQPNNCCKSVHVVIMVVIILLLLLLLKVTSQLSVVLLGDDGVGWCGVVWCGAEQEVYAQKRIINSLYS